MVLNAQRYTCYVEYQTVQCAILAVKIKNVGFPLVKEAGFLLRINFQFRETI